jgi:muramoyltetrapeptide carboxypeptidase
MHHNIEFNKVRMIKPKSLKKGDKIAIVAPAGKIAKEKVFSAKKVLESYGLEVMIGTNVFNPNYQYSASDEKRLSDIQQALDDDSVKAILFARGGYGSNRIIDKINFSHFKKNPKWLVGFSDITVFHSHIHTQFQVETLHASMTAGILSDEKDEATQSLMKALFDEKLEYRFPSNPLSRPGKASGLMVGGNIAILCSLIGTASDLHTDGKVLFIEEIGEHLYKIDRMMWQLKRSGKLDKLAGLVVGGMTDIPDDKAHFGKNTTEIIHEITAEYNYPVCFDFPAGHQKDNRALVFGREISMKISGRSIIQFK